MFSTYKLVWTSLQHDNFRAVETIYMVAWSSKTNVLMNNVEAALSFFDVASEVMHCCFYRIPLVSSKS